MLRELSRAAVAAVSPGGFFVPMPPEVPLHGQQVIAGHSTALEFVAADDLRLVIHAWQDAHEVGTASVQVRAVRDADNLLTIHYVDATEEFGVFLCFIIGDVAFLTARERDAGAMRPRVSVVRKTDKAVFISVDDAAEKLLGRTDLVGQRNVDLIHPERTHPAALPTGWTCWRPRARADGCGCVSSTVTDPGSGSRSPTTTA